MSEKLLQQALLEACQQEFAPFEDGGEHRFSRDHKRKMKAMFKEFSRKPKKKISLKRRIVIVAIAVLVTGLLGVTAVAVANRFGIFGVFHDHTEIITNDRSDVPTQIEDIYCLPNPPLGYHLYEYSANIGSVTFIYISETDVDINGFPMEMMFDQCTKDDYHSYINTEGYEIVNIYVENYEGYYVDFDHAILLVWDNNDYVFELYSDQFNLDELLEMAKTVCIDPEAEFGYWCDDE